MEETEEKLLNYLAGKYGKETANEIYKMSLLSFNSMLASAQIYNMDVQTVIDIAGTTMLMARLNHKRQAEMEVNNIMDIVGDLESKIDKDFSEDDPNK